MKEPLVLEIVQLKLKVGSNKLFYFFSSVQSVYLSTSGFSEITLYNLRDRWAVLIQIEQLDSMLFFFVASIVDNILAKYV